MKPSKGANRMKQEELLALAKQLQIADDRGLLAKVVISRSEMAKALNIAFGMNSQGAGPEGFIGVFQDQLVCFEANLWGTKPETERFRMSFEFIVEQEIKKGFLGLNNIYLIKTKEHKFKLYFTNGRMDVVKKIYQTIEDSKKK
jgi:hypothetical protein